MTRRCWIPLLISSLATTRFGVPGRYVVLDYHFAAKSRPWTFKSYCGDSLGLTIWTIFWQWWAFHIYIYSGINFSDSKRTNHVRFWFHIHSIFHIHSMSSPIELDYGKIYRKALYLMVKTMVSCRFSQQNQSSESREPLARSLGFHSWGHLNRTLASMASRMPPELVQDGIHRTKTPYIQRIGSLKVVSLADLSDSEKTCSICIAASSIT